MPQSPVWRFPPTGAEVGGVLLYLIACLALFAVVAFAVAAFGASLDAVARWLERF